ncbi:MULTISPECIES: four helix bundle protein [unclassified Wenzhouxiangella]|uniref:four helix bundle protein n=1 Tax=unclassified Wenzhouxiangella TaxID=2613841 RepID=UPI000E3268AC|nr:MULTISPECIES: four helix bundle protein [unclassified Wenzhouxiangella]RFF27305.1 four helix bundle protein [Wenzhouxiangella sp. 15181]RFP68738.1 four helix bundle protein [Wenzhouxiangella sp. 15190]
MTETTDNSSYDLEDRTFEFARSVRQFCKGLPRTIGNIEDAKQLIRASGSVGANYIEANEALSKRDFRHRIRIARKESKEAQYWLRLLDCRDDQSLLEQRSALVEEGRQLMLILGAILRNSS